MTKKIYRWNLERLIAFGLAFMNLLFVLFVGWLVIYKEDFIRLHTGVKTGLSQTHLLLISVSLLGLVMFLCRGFLKRRYGAWMVLALVESLWLAYVIRNIFLMTIYDQGLSLSLPLHLGLFAYLGMLVYMTLFSSHIRSYYQLKTHEGDVSYGES